MFCFLFLSFCFCSLESSCVTSQCCKYLSSAVFAKHSVLTALQLRGNNLEDEGMRLLCEGLRNPNCKLQILEVESCGLTTKGCEFLSLTLSSEYSQLQELDLESNTLKDSGAIWLCEGIRSPHCKLHRLRLAFCQLTHECCKSFSSALSVEHSLLMELELEGNELGDEGVNLLCEGLRKPNCKLEKLWLDKCGLTSGCCGDLSSALCTEHSRLTELHLGDNKLANSGVQLLCKGLRSLNCKLERLRLWSCGLTSKCCESLLSALCAEHSNLTVLDLTENNLTDAGARLLCEALRNPNCKLEKSAASLNKISLPLFHSQSQERKSKTKSDTVTVMEISANYLPTHFSQSSSTVCAGPSNMMKDSFRQMIPRLPVSEMTFLYIA
uniref:Uncharacterized protein n=1 Tax=Erpetoichthys calabaricus TaxID=27687 RepID=A0A8C4XBS6_ERPCA